MDFKETKGKLSTMDVDELERVIAELRKKTMQEMSGDETDLYVEAKRALGKAKTALLKQTEKKVAALTAVTADKTLAGTEEGAEAQQALVAARKALEALRKEDNTKANQLLEMIEAIVHFGQFKPIFERILKPGDRHCADCIARRRVEKSLTEATSDEDRNRLQKEVEGLAVNAEGKHRRMSGVSVRCRERLALAEEYDATRKLPPYVNPNLTIRFGDKIAYFHDAKGKPADPRHDPLVAAVFTELREAFSRCEKAKKAREAEMPNDEVLGTALQRRYNITIELLRSLSPKKADIRAHLKARTEALGSFRKAVDELPQSFDDFRTQFGVEKTKAEQLREAFQAKVRAVSKALAAKFTMDEANERELAEAMVRSGEPPETLKAKIAEIKTVTGLRVCYGLQKVTAMSAALGEAGIADSPTAPATEENDQAKKREAAANLEKQKRAGIKLPEWLQPLRNSEAVTLDELKMLKKHLGKTQPTDAASMVLKGVHRDVAERVIAALAAGDTSAASPATNVAAPATPAEAATVGTES